MLQAYNLVNGLYSHVGLVDSVEWKDLNLKIFVYNHCGKLFYKQMEYASPRGVD